ncbi:MAG: hypothetical protein HQ518_09930 [Rhodopirellula sp.]|nr:hypothetical protein [Rhodopirellula sp.]
MNNRRSLRVLHISDLHFGPPDRPTVGEALQDAPPDAARIVVAHHHFAPAPAPEALLAEGAIADRSDD